MRKSTSSRVITGLGCAKIPGLELMAVGKLTET